MDAAFWTLDLSAPACVEAISSPVNDQSAPAWSIVTYQYPARGEMPACKVVWYDGGKKPERPKELEEGRELDTNGMLMVGEKGTILADTYGGSPRIIPETKMRDFLPNRPEKTLPRSPGHYEEFIRACKGGEPAGSNFDYAGPLTEMVLLGNLAIRTGQKIDWVAEKMVCTNLRKAKQYVRHGYCKF